MAGKTGQIFKNGFVNQNPTFRLVLGTCPTLAVTTTMVNGIGMGIATTFVLVFSNILISLLKSVIPDRIRIPAFIMIIATFVTIVDMVMNKFTPDLYESLGVFIPLIVVNCIIFARAEAFASANPVIYSALDGIAMGLGFTVSITFIGFMREMLSLGMSVFALPAGGFLMYGLLMAAFNALYKFFDGIKKKNHSPHKAETEEKTV